MTEPQRGPERLAHPDVDTALLGPRGAQLGRHEAIRHEEQDGEDDPPREALHADGGGGGHRVGNEDSRHAEQDHVEETEGSRRSDPVRVRASVDDS